MVVRMRSLTKMIAVLIALAPIGLQTAHAREVNRSPAYLSMDAVFADPGLKNALSNPALLPPPSAFTAQEKHLVEVPQSVPVSNGRVPSYPSASAF